MSAVGSMLARGSTTAVGWIGTSGRLVVGRVASGQGLAGDAVAVRDPRRQIEETAPLGTERSVWFFL
jgi:hypothetical protein